MRREIVLRKTWEIVGLTLSFLALLELTARVGYSLRDRLDEAQQINWLLSSDVYRDQDWAAEYFRERDETLWISHADWHSYVYWRHAPYHGKYINIDQKGIRSNWNKTEGSSSNDIKVFVFGGSALWGTGARDEYTIPSLVSRKLNAQGRAVWVTNIGEEGYVSTQEVIALMLELQKGNVPNLVIFYDGANDIFSAFQQDVAGIPQNEFNRLAEFNQFNWRGGLLERGGLYRLVRTVTGRMSHPVRTDAQDLTLANAVVDTYIANMETVASLAREYGFAVAFYWQPVIYYKKNLSAWEKQQLDTYGEAKFFIRADQVLKSKVVSKTHSSFHDLSDIFREQVETVFIDLFHISEAGNERIAELIAQTLELRWLDVSSVR